MDVEIGDLNTTVRAVDGDALLTPQVMQRIVRAVLQAVQEREAHGKRVHAEQRVSLGVSHELEGEER